jgi:hypothetical protein
MRERSILCLMLLLAVTGLALPIYGPRAMALGGAYVALADDESSVYYNPAAMADARDYFACVPNFGIVSDDRITEAVDGFYAAKDDIYSSIPDQIIDADDLAPFIDSLEAAHDYLADYEDGSAGVAGYLSYGGGVMLGPVALSWIGTGDGQVSFETDADTGRLVPSGLLNDPFIVLALYQEEILDAEQLTTLWPTYPDPSGFVGDIEGNNVGLDDNRTLTRLSNDARQDLVLTYADYLLRSDDDQWAVSAGVNLKYIITQAYRTTFTADDAELGTTGPLWITERLIGVQPVLGSTFSADLGLYARLTEFANLGLVGRDVIPRAITWDEPVVGAPERLEPHWRLGLAGHILPGLLSVAVDVDLQESTGVFSPQQDLSAGVRLTMPGDSFWAGAGIRYNLADEEQTPLYTLGGGFNIMGIRFDLSLGLGVVDFSGEVDTYFSAAAGVGFSM